MLIQPYDPKWPKDFLAIKQILQAGLPHHQLVVEHIGSTAIPGLPAKPIIDIDIIYQHTAEFEHITEALLRLNYYHNGDQGLVGREVFKRTTPSSKHPVLDTIKHHLYVCPANSIPLKEHLLFRNYLRQHNWAREAYAQLKHEIATSSNQSKKAYAKLKEHAAKPFVNSILQKAEAKIKRP